MLRKNTQKTTLPTPSTDTNADEPKAYTRAETLAIKERYDELDQQQIQLEQQIEALKEQKSDVVFELMTARNGKPFKDASGNEYSFTNRGNRHLLRKKSAVVDEL